MSTCNCPSLFKPGKIGSIELRNRSVMPAMGMSNSPGGFITEGCIRHYVERARGGIGLIVVEVACIDYPLGLNTENMIRADDDKFIPGLRKLASAIHAAGAKCVLEISHTGRGAKKEITGGQPLGPSPIPMPMMYTIGVERKMPRELTIPEIEEIEDRYAAGAYRAMQAGFDGVEMHFTGYYLGYQFLSSESNIRTDIYGGSLENRFRFLQNVCEKTRARCGYDFALLVKCTVCQFTGGVTMDEGKYFLKRLIEMNVDGVEATLGASSEMPGDNDVPFTDGTDFPGMETIRVFSDYVRAEFGDSRKTQLIAGGDFRNAAPIEKALSENICDFVYIGKSTVVEPYFVKLLEEGRDAEIHPCIGCYICATIQLATGHVAYCSGNGAMWNDNRYDLPSADRIKKVVVVGGGPAGIEAARVLKLRGHDVTLIEKSDKLGGQVYYAMEPLHKGHFKPLIPYFYETVRANGINVLYNTEATVESVLAMDPDAVICATGVRPGKLPVPGIDMPHVVSGKDYLIGAKKVDGKRVVVVGGGDVGCEIAEKLGAEGHEVTIVEMLDVLAPGYMFGNRALMLHHLQMFGVTELMATRCHSIHEDRVEVADKIGFLFNVPCDNVVICTGDPSNNALYEGLKGLVPELYNVGDSDTPANLAMAHANAYKAARDI